jgi:hypothetical protein
MDRRSVLGGALASGMWAATAKAQTAAAKARRGRFTGRLRVDIDGADGIGMTLAEPFGYVDPDGTDWPVRAGAKINGASIPRVFWSIVGGPFEGRYRQASVVHDWYCDVRQRPAHRVHRMFYEAMIDSGVDPLQASTMYAAVKACGPRWNQQAVDNARLLARASSPSIHCPPGIEYPNPRCTETPAAGSEPPNLRPPITDPHELQKLVERVRAEKLGPSTIDQLYPPEPDTILRFAYTTPDPAGPTAIPEAADGFTRAFSNIAPAIRHGF